MIGLVCFHEAFSLLGGCGAPVIAAGMLAVSLDKRPAVAAPGSSGSAGEAASQKAKGSSFGMQPDDGEEAAAAGSRQSCHVGGCAAGAACSRAAARGRPDSC